MKRLILCFCLLGLGCLSSINSADAMQANGHRPLTQNETKLFNAVKVGIPYYGFYNPYAVYHEGKKAV